MYFSTCPDNRLLEINILEKFFFIVICGEAKGDDKSSPNYCNQFVIVAVTGPIQFQTEPLSRRP